MIFGKKKLKQKTNLFPKFVFIMFIFLLPVFVNAQIEITEIMYDPEGSDTGREWVEILNTGDESIDLTNWKFDDEATSKHKLYVPPDPNRGGQGSIIIEPNTYIILSSDANIFISEHTGFSATVIDTTMNLKQKDDQYTISIWNNKENIEDTVDYVVNKDIEDMGNSLQLINGEWKEATPTPGAPNVFETSDNQTENQNTTQNEIVLPELKKPQIFAEAGKDKTLIAGADTQFKGMAYGLENKPIENARFSWSFGDGSIQDGQDILHNYKYPGDYIVVLNVSSGEHSASDRILVEALPADIIISNVNNEFIELQNKSNYELNLSWWRIRSDKQFFTLPKDTIILSNTKLKISSNISGFYLNDLSQVYLLYPNGEIVSKYNPNTINEYPNTPNSTNTNNSIVENFKSQIPNSEKLQNSNDQNLKNKDLGVRLPSEEENLALVGNVYNNNENKSSLLNKWTFSLMGLILVSISSVLVVRRLDDEIKKKEQLKPEDFKIIDE